MAILGMVITANYGQNGYFEPFRVILAIVKMSVNMIIMGVFGNVWENLDQQRKRQLKRCFM